MNLNDYRILSAIIDKEDKTKGIKEFNGTTIKEIVAKTQLSERKIRETKDKLLKRGFIREGIKNMNIKSYVMTQLGIEELKKTMEGNK